LTINSYNIRNAYICQQIMQRWSSSSSSSSSSYKTNLVTLSVLFSTCLSAVPNLSFQNQGKFFTETEYHAGLCLAQGLWSVTRNIFWNYMQNNGMSCNRQRLTKLLTTFTNVWTHAPRPVVDILNKWYELYTEMIWLNCFRNCNKLSVLTRCFSSNSKVHCKKWKFIGWLRLIWYNFVKFRENWIKLCHLM